MKKFLLILSTVFVCSIFISVSAYAMGQDSYESNNTTSTATAISNGKYSANLHNTSDVDYYKFTVTQAYKAASVTVTPTVTSGLTNSELKIQIIPPSGTAANSYVSGTGKRNANFACINTGTYYIKVYGNSNANGREYSLHFDVSAPSVSMWAQTIAQEKTNWCWAACAEMTGEAYWRIVNNYQKPLRDVTQTQIVQNVHGNTLDTASKSIDETASALDFALDLTFGKCDGVSYAYSKDEIFRRIWTNCQTIIARVGRGTQMGHNVVIKGIRINDDSTMLTIIDPANGADVLSVDLDVMKNSGYRPSDNRVWTHTVKINKTIQ